MDTVNDIKTKISEKGYAIINDVFTFAEIEQLSDIISAADTSNPVFRKTKDLFAIRQFLKEIPAVISVVFNKKINKIISSVFGDDYFVVKSIYFDKPEDSNWFVAYHQDLTISVDKKTDIDGFGPWTAKHNQYSVQPPLKILKDNFTIRIHLDDTDENNGALKVIRGSHLKNIFRPETINRQTETEDICEVNKGGIMLMKPLLMHSSGRTTNNNKRRVIHIEFSRSILPAGLKWPEFVNIPFENYAV